MRCTARSRTLCWLAILLGTSLLGDCGDAGRGVKRSDQVQSGGRSRTFTTYVPSAYRPGQPRPLLIGFHGGGGTGDGLRVAVGGDALAERYNVITAYPDAVAEAR